MKRKLILLTLLALLIAALAVTVSAETVNSGTCGDNLTWTLDDAGTLTISGTGAMYDYSQNDEAPWGSSFAIKAVVIEEGVTSIGDYAIFYCENVKSVIIPEGVTLIGEGAFVGLNCRSIATKCRDASTYR